MSAKTTQRLKALQRRLEVTADGILGPVTLTRLEEVVDQALGPVDVEARLTVSTQGLTQLIGFEISSFANYERRLARPTWPGGGSGVTIGIGYDLGTNTAGRIDDDWRRRIADDDVDLLRTAAGVLGAAAEDILPRYRHLVIPLEAAKEVFFQSTLPRFAARTRRAYPGIEELPADAQAMLLSLVYNRGGSMSGARRREMKAIRPLVLDQDLDGIADQIRAMKRLWDPVALPGLHRRRDREAELVAASRRDYDPEELVVL